MISSSTFSVRKIGIALAAYQPPLDSFRKQLDSIQKQTWKEWICVLTFDSPLNPVRKDPAFQSFFQDPRFFWIENPNRLGTKKNFERAIQETLKRGANVVACSDQDDVWYPEKLEKSARLLNHTGPLSLVHCDMHELKEGPQASNRKVSEHTVWEIERRGVQNTRPHHLITRNVVAGCAMLFDAELARRYPTIPDAVPYHDHWFALVASVHGGVHALHEPLYQYRIHGGNELGVTPFQGVMATDHKTASIQTKIQKCKDRWNWSRQMALALHHTRLPVSLVARICYLWKFDLGIGLLFIGLVHLLRDPALSRACFARAVGKFTALGR